MPTLNDEDDSPRNREDLKTALAAMAEERVATIRAFTELPNYGTI